MKWLMPSAVYGANLPFVWVTKYSICAQALQGRISAAVSSRSRRMRCSRVGRVVVLIRLPRGEGLAKLLSSGRMARRKNQQTYPSRPPEPRVPMMYACGHESDAPASADPHRVATELGCQNCRQTAMCYQAGLSELTDEELIEHGRKCRELAEKGIPYWQRKLEIARSVWRARKEHNRRWGR